MVSKKKRRSKGVEIENNKKVNTKKVSPSVRRDFEVFAKGVERLEEIKSELNGLNTKGYEGEASSIRSKLKNVSYIPEIEEELSSLKEKINGTYSNRSLSVDHVEISKKVKELKRVVPRSNSAIHKKILELEKQIPDKDKIQKKISSLEENVGLVKNIPKIQSQLRVFKEFIDQKKKEEARKKELLKKIDPNINFLINDKFNLSLNDIKSELSRKVKDKELETGKQLQEDLETRKNIFEQQYRNLVDKFEEKYHEKVESSLKREIKIRFHKELSEKLDNLRGSLVRENVKKLASGKNKLNDLRSKKIKEMKDLRKDYDSLKKKLLRDNDSKLRKLESMANAELLSHQKDFSEKKRKKLNEINKKQKNKLEEIKILKSDLEELKVKLEKEKESKLKEIVRSLRDAEKQKLIELESAREKLESMKIDLEKGDVKRGRVVEREARVEKGILRRRVNAEVARLKKLEKKKSFEIKKLRESFGVLGRKLIEENNKKLRESEEATKFKIFSQERQKLFDLALSGKLLRAEEKKFNDLKKAKLLKLELSRQNLAKLKKNLEDGSVRNLREMRKSISDEGNRKLLELKSAKEKLIKLINNIKIEETRKIGNMERKIRLQGDKKIWDKLQKKKASLEKQYKNRLNKEKQSLRKHFDEEILVHKVILSNRMKRYLTDKTIRIHHDYKNKVSKKDQEVNKIKRRLEGERGVVSRLRNRLDVRAQKIRNDEASYRKNIMAQLEKEKQDSMRKMVREQSVIIRKKLRNEFNERLKLEIGAKEAELERKKSDLELELQSRLKQILR